MRIVVQRVKEARVEVGSEIVGQIGEGLLILLGIEEQDSEEDAHWLCNKVAQMRIFSDKNNQMNLSVKDIGGEVLVVSQFTLHASTKKGNRPSFIRAARPEQAIPLYEHFKQTIEELLDKPVASGIFGADMQVSLKNNGPVTIFVDSKDRQ